jgi:hypothetical protein
MPSPLWPFGTIVPRRGKHAARWRPVRRPTLEQLESRTLLRGGTLATALPLTFGPLHTAQVAGVLADPHEVDLYRLHLGAGDRIRAAVSAQDPGSALQSLLRIFDAQGKQLALDDQEGGDPSLTFQAAQTGDYYVGVSSAPNDGYDPTAPDRGSTGGSTGLYTLNLRDTAGAPLQADLAGSSFRLTTDAAAYGDTLPVAFTVENRGGADAGAFQVQVLLSATNLFTPAASLMLQTFTVTGLAAGAEFASGAVTVVLPGAAAAHAAGLPASGPLYVGLRIVPGGPTQDAGTADKSGVHRGADWEKLTVVTPVTASGGNHSPASADVLADPNSRVSGVLTVGQAEWYGFTVSANARLTVKVTAATGTLVPLLTLAGPSGQVLVQSDSGIVQYLPPGNYTLSISAVSGAGAYQLTSEYVQASPPFGPAGPASWGSYLPVVADLNNDGIPDIVVTSGENTVSVLLGNGDGTFGPPQTYAVGSLPYSVAVADVNGDGHPDIIVANGGGSKSPSNVSVLLGNGDGTFQPQRTFAVDGPPDDVVVADVNGDGIPDIITGNKWGTGPKSVANVSVLLGTGDGTFQLQQSFAISSSVNVNVTLAVADLNGDGIPDLVTNAFGRETVWLGNGDGTFRQQEVLPVDSAGYGLAVADVNGDGKLDIVTDNVNGSGPSSTVSLLLGNGDGTFQPPKVIPTGTQLFVLQQSIVVADVTGDGKPDIVSAFSILLGNGDGTFRPPSLLNTFSAQAVADVNGDGKTDLVGYGALGTQVLLGNGDGTFQSPPGFTTGSFGPPREVTDLNGDGKPDIVTSNNSYNSVSVLLGNGDGSFGPPQNFAAGSGVSAVAVADVNGDGKPDIITANSGDNTVSVLLGNGDGTFRPPETFAVGSSPEAVAVADLNGDGIPDLIVADIGLFDPKSRTYVGNDVRVLLGNGDGTFQPQRVFAAGKKPDAVAVADVNGDGIPDLVVGSDQRSQGVSVLLGNGDGTFQRPKTFSVAAGSYPRWVAVADLNGDGKPDIVAFGINKGSVLLGNGDGTFQAPESLPVTDGGPVAVADVNGDGKPDIVVTGAFSPYGADVLLGNGDGTFQAQRFFGTSYPPGQVVVADVNGDGRPDLVSGIGVLLGHGDGTFTPLSPSSGVDLRNTPYLADLTGDDLLDSVVLDGSGNILFRKALPGADSPFAPPVTLNPGRPARDLTVLHTATGPVIATADASFDRTLSGPNHFVYTVSLYAVAANGTARRTTAFSTTLLPTRLAAADLTGNGLDDLVVADSLDNSIQVAFQQPGGTFSPPITLPTGEAPSDLSLADVTGDGLSDIVVSNQGSGDVSVFVNDPGHTFATSYRFRGGTSLYGLDTTTASPTISTIEQSVSLAAGDFTGHGRTDVVVVNRGSDSFAVLPNDGRGGLGNPQAALTTSTSDGPAVNAQAGPVVTGDFHGPGQPLDLAILMKDRAEVWVYTGTGDGTFRHTFSIPAGANPTGLNTVRNPQTGQLDLLVGDPFGDVLHLQGKGDGTFQAPGSRVSLAVADLDNGQPAALVANQQTDRVTVQAPAAGGASFAPVVTLADGAGSTLAPGAVQWARLDKNSALPDAVVLASGSNEVLVYRATGFDAAGRPTFAPPVSYPVGTDPVSVTIQDLNGDGVPDLLVADAGSNDVAELFGSWDASGNWVATLGPRLKTGGSGPVAATVRDVTGDGIPDLVVTNGTSGTLSVLPGVGQGFFNDQSPRVLNVPGNPVLGAPAFVGTSGVGVVPTGTGQLFGVNLNTLTVTPQPVFAPPAGEGVAAVQALADGDLVVAEEGGGVQLLAPGPGAAQYEPVQTYAALTGIPSEPSALAVLADGDVLVTSEGTDQLFVFGVAAPGLPASPAQAVVLPELAVPAAPVAEPSAPGGAPLALVVTLVADVLPSGTAAAGGTEAPAAAPDGSDASRAAVEPAVDSAGFEDEDTPADPVAPSADEVDPVIEEILRHLDLSRPTDEDAWGGPIARQTVPEVPAPPGGDVAAFWQLVGAEAPDPPVSEEVPVRTHAADQVGEPAVAVRSDAAWFEVSGLALPGSGPTLPGRGPQAAAPIGAWERALFAALATGGLAVWADRRSRSTEGRLVGWPCPEGRIRDGR